MIRAGLLAALFAGGAVAQWSDKERALGRAVTADFERTHKRFEDAALHEYLRAMAARLSAVKVQVTVLESEDVIAVNFPGGHVYLSTAFISAQPDEAALAWELAHQIAHTTDRQVLRPARAVNVASIPLIYVGGGCTRSSRVSAVPLGFVQAAKRFELEADVLAAEYVSEAGYRAGDAQFGFERVRPRVPEPKPRRRPTLRRPRER